MRLFYSKTEFISEFFTNYGNKSANCAADMIPEVDFETPWHALWSKIHVILLYESIKGILNC